MASPGGPSRTPPTSLTAPLDFSAFAKAGSHATASRYRASSSTITRSSASSRSSRAGVSSRSEEHTSELQSQSNLVCRLLLEKKKKYAGTILGLMHVASAHHHSPRGPLEHS